MLLYSSAEARTKYGRVVELVDSLDSGSSVHCGRAGSSPASPTKKKDIRWDVLFICFGTWTNQNATVRWTVAGDGWTEPNLYFCLWQKCKSSPFSPTKRRQAIGVHHKGQFSKIRCILKKICRILHLCPQMQCLSGKLTRHRWTKKAPLCKGSCQRSWLRDCFTTKICFTIPPSCFASHLPLHKGGSFLPSRWKMPQFAG